MTNKHRLFVFALLGGMALLPFIGCGGNNGDQQKSNHHQYTKRGPIAFEKTYKGDYPIEVVCTTGMVADLVRNVGGKHVKVVQLMKEGVDPHLYQPSGSDVGTLRSAKMIFYSGLHLEGKMIDTLESLRSKTRPVIPVAEFYEREELLMDTAGVDPHVWFDVELWNKARDVVEKTLIAYDPMHSDDYHKSGRLYGKQLELLHEQIEKDITSKLPKKEARILVTAHDAFNYFGKKYDFTVKGVQGISTESKASVAHVSELVNFLVKNKVKAVFFESSVNKNSLNALIEGCADQKHTVVLGGELFSDAMGKQGTTAGTYIGMIRHNVDTITNALK